MPPELRKRKAPATEPAAAPPTKKKGPIAEAVAKVKEAVTASPKAVKTNGSSGASKVAVGGTINLEGFGGEIETNDGVKTTLKKLVDESTGGGILFTYPKASTPGCTKQACMFRDSHTDLTSTGFSIYGLSRDSPKTNTTFKQKQNLPYPLLCDPSATLISAIGLKKAPTSTVRGVFVVDKTGKVLAAEPGSPGGTVDVVKKLIGGGAAPALADEKPNTELAVNGTNGADADDANSPAPPAETEEKLDSNEEKPAAL